MNYSLMLLWIIFCDFCDNENFTNWRYMVATIKFFFWPAESKSGISFGWLPPETLNNLEIINYYFFFIIRVFQ